MTNPFDDVREFHRFFGHSIGTQPRLLDEKTWAFRKMIMDEEYNKELHEAVAAGDLVEIADALADILYVVIGTAITMGIPIEHVWKEVHKSNMAKAIYFRHADGCALMRSDAENPTQCDCGAVQYKPDGKTKKPDGWIGPTDAIRFLLAR